jgi:hypothetical protein
MSAAPTQYYPAKQILHGLWVGSRGDSRDLAFMRRHDIALVVNCSRDIPSRFRHGLGIRYVRVAVDDAPHEQAKMLASLPRVVPAIEAALRAGHGVLVHCHAGMQRSAAVAAAYLMWKRRLSSRQAMGEVNRVKEETFFPTPTFAEALAAWGERLGTQNPAVRPSSLRTSLASSPPH